jgi:mRNA interferase HigB
VPFLVLSGMDLDLSAREVLRLLQPGAVALNGERARFEVAGGNFRLIAAFSFRHQIAFIKFVGTHTEYDKVDALTVACY